jgi:hypothetical protein
LPSVRWWHDTAGEVDPTARAEERSNRAAGLLYQTSLTEPRVVYSGGFGVKELASRAVLMATRVS